MSNRTDTAATAFDEAVAQIPTCALDEDGIVTQRDRYARLGSDVRRIEREPEAVIIGFRNDFDRELLEETLEVERACCPFFLFHFDEERRILTTTVREREQLPALDAMEHALGAAQKARG